MAQPKRTVARGERLSPLAERLQWILKKWPEKFPSERSLSEAAGLGHSYVSLVLKGERGATGRIDDRTVSALAQATGLDPVWISTGRNAPPGAPGTKRNTPPSGLRFNTRMAQALALLGGTKVHPHAREAAVQAADGGEGDDWSVDEWIDYIKALHAKAKELEGWDPNAAE